MNKNNKEEKNPFQEVDDAFDKKFPFTIYNEEDIGSPEMNNDIKAFIHQEISQALQRQREELLGKVEVLPTFKAMKNLVKLNGKTEETEIDIIEKKEVKDLLA